MVTDLKKVRRQLDLLCGGVERVYPTSEWREIMMRRARMRFLRANPSGRPHFSLRMPWRADREDLIYEDAVYRIQAAREMRKRVLATLSHEETIKVMVGDV